MIKNNKAFTLTEIIAAIIVLGIILLIAIPNASNLQKKFKDSYYEKLDDTTLETGKSYFKDNPESKPSVVLGASFANYDDPLIKSKYIKSIKKYNSDEDCTGRVVSVLLGDYYKYVNCMDCGSDYVNYNSSKMDEDSKKICKFKEDDVIIKDYNPSDKYLYLSNYNVDAIKNMVCVYETVIRKDSSEQIELYRLVDNSSELKCPSNISSIDIHKIGIYKAIYKNIKVKESATSDIQKNVIVFQHDAPTFVKDDSSYLVNKIDNIYYVNGKVKVRLDNTSTFGSLYHSYPDHFEIYNSSWNSMSKISNYEAYYTFNENSSSVRKIKFRIVGNDNETLATKKVQYGKESEELNIVSNKITITFIHNDGTSGKHTKAMWAGFPLENEPVLQRTNYIFDGYYTSLNGGEKYIDYNGKVIGEKIIKDDTILYAHWINNAFNVRYDCTTNGGVCNFSPTSLDINQGSQIDLTRQATKIKDGIQWTFIGWNTNPNATTKINNMIMGNESITLYAIYKKVVTVAFYQTNGNKSIKTCEIYNNNNNCLITSPALNTITDPNSTSTNVSNAIKIGWADNENINISSWSENKGEYVSDNCSYYALYSYPVTVGYNSNGGTGTIVSSIGEGYINAKKDSSVPSYTTATIRLKDNKFSKTGYNFSNWAMSSENGTKYLAGDTIELLKNKTMYAIWGPKKITVIFDANGGNNSSSKTQVSQTFTYGVAGQKFGDTGFSFGSWILSGWYWSKENKTYSINSSVIDSWIDKYASISPITVTALWKKTLNAVFHPGRSEWFNEKTISCTITYPTTTCKITIPDVENISGYNKRGVSPDSTYINYRKLGNQPYTDLIETLGWVEFDTGSSTTIPNSSEIIKAGTKIVLDSTVNQKNKWDYYMYSRIKNFSTSKEYDVFPNNKNGLNFRTKPTTSATISGILLTSSSNIAKVKIYGGSVYFRYVSGESNKLWLRVTATNGKCAKNDSGTPGGDCTNKWASADWIQF